MTAAPGTQAAQALRLDVWLWAARWFKTRALARQAIEAGRVRVADGPCKPAHALRGGESLQISRGDEHFVIVVLALSAQRGPASVAQTLYRETDASAQARSARAAQRRVERRAAPQPPPTRPDKRDRRRLHAFKQQGRDPPTEPS